MRRQMNRTSKETLIGFRPLHDSFVGIDSDGCVFPTMDIKQKQCFHPEIVRHWKLETIEPYVRESMEFVNLHSKWRGTNRFQALIVTFDFLRDRHEVRASGVAISALTSLRRYVGSGVPLSNTSLEAEVEKTGDPELTLVLQWSTAINTSIERTVKHVPPFAWARESLTRISAHSDMIVVSQTPEEALVREWKENGIDGIVSAIAGQELGTKAEHIAMATKDRYPQHRILMIGDAPGDFKAARANRAFFFPVNPGHENESWKCFCAEAYDRFLNGSYGGRYETDLIAAFDKLLPETPPWIKSQ